MKRILSMMLVLMLAGVTALAEQEVIPGRLEANVPVQADLDGDGEMETVSWWVNTVDEYNEEAVIAFQDGNTTGEWHAGMMYCLGVYAVDLDQDGATEIFFSGDEASDDYVTFCLKYRDGVLEQLHFPDVNRGENMNVTYPWGYGMVTGLGDGTVTLRGSQDFLGTYFCNRVFKLVDGQFVTADDGLWVVQRDFDDPERWEYAALTLIAPLEVVMMDGEAESTVVLPKGTKLMVKGSDKISTVYFVTRDGQTCRAAIAADPDDWGSLVNGVPEREVFEFLPYAD